MKVRELMSLTTDLYDEDYYRKYYGKKDSYEFNIESVKKQPFVAFIKKIAQTSCRKSQKLRILDVGCAKGFLVKMLKDSGFEAYGVDVSDFALKNCPQDVQGNLFLLDVENQVLPFKKHWFNVVASIGTLEHLHLEKIPYVLSEIHRVLRPNGLLIISVPYFYNKIERSKVEHFSVLPNDYWIDLFRRHSLKYNNVLTNEIGDSIREEMAKRFEEHPEETRTIKYALIIIPNKRFRFFFVYTLLKLKGRIYPSVFTSVFNSISDEDSSEC